MVGGRSVGVDGAAIKVCRHRESSRLLASVPSSTVMTPTLTPTLEALSAEERLQRALYTFAYPADPMVRRGWACMLCYVASHMSRVMSCVCHLWPKNKQKNPNPQKKNIYRYKKCCMCKTCTCTCTSSVCECVSENVLRQNEYC